MTDFDIHNRDEVDWIIARDHLAIFDIFEVGARGWKHARTLKAIPRNAERVLDTDGMIVARLAARLADEFQAFRDRIAPIRGDLSPHSRLPSRMKEATPTAPPAPATPSPKPAVGTLLPKMPLPPHLQKRRRS